MKKRFLTLAMALSCVIALTFAIAGCSGGGNSGDSTDGNDTHEHVFATEWSYDATHHYHECIYDDCNEITDKGEHTYYDKKCTTCGYVKSSEGLAFELNADGVSYILAGIGECTDTDVVVPATYENLPVTTLGFGAFQDAPITSVVIPNSVTAMENNVFSGCTSLTSVSLSNNITSISMNAFKDCTSLTSLTIPEGVTTIAQNAFNSCNLERLDIPASITTIYEAFNYSKIKEVNVADIGAWCNITFCNRKGTYNLLSNPLCAGKATLLLNGEIVTDLVIPEGVTEIKPGTFANNYNNPNTSIKSVTIPSSLTKIGSDAFANCNGIESVYITDVAAWCKIDFAEESSNPFATSKLHGTAKLYVNGEIVTDLVIPEGVTEIKPFAFQNCTQLTSVTIPSTVTTIGDKAFRYCEKLKTVNIPNSVKNINDQAFFNCSALTDINFDGTTTEWQGITKNYWLNPTGQCTIHCTDGGLKP